MENLNLDCDGRTTNEKVENENVAEHFCVEVNSLRFIHCWCVKLGYFVQMEIQKEKEIISFGSLEVVECIVVTSDSVVLRDDSETRSVKVGSSLFYFRIFHLFVSYVPVLSDFSGKS
jgi:hypothetical protein